MIKASELRIGNWILLNNNPVEVYGTLLDYCSKKTEVPEFSPIPLTPEILKNCGFEVHKTLGSYYIYKLGGFKINMSINGEAFFCYVYNGTKQIKHLHQLQNLYFAITSKELEIAIPLPSL